MKSKFIAIITSMFLSTNAVSADEWTDGQTNKAIALALLTAADWGSNSKHCKKS